MSFQVFIKTEKSLHQLASEIGALLSLPPFKRQRTRDALYYQFEMLGMLVMIHYLDEEDRAPEVLSYPYVFTLELTFTEHDLNTDDLEYRLQPYYARLLSFHLGVETAYHEQQQINQRWRIRYHFCRKNPSWKEDILYGEPGWQPAVIEEPPSEWRNQLVPW
ncbi:hypothetical protein [Thermogemmatispora carboxidivorans]|uniref:hypothetical protein n=1 Tax=Thermogemmatispora carboxidivorans TaxID=1382306 RepID=UPI00069C142D|nr:hypothetical protein [Thermogemmatispora carboxidivorans]